MIYCHLNCSENPSSHASGENSQKSNNNSNNEKELDNLIQTIRIYSQNLGKESGIAKCAMLIMKSGKRESTEGVQLKIRERIRTLNEKEDYKYLGNLEAGIIKHAGMREK